MNVSNASDLILFSVLIMFLIIATIQDFKNYKIKNYLIMIGIFTGSLLNILTKGTNHSVYILINIIFPIIILYLIYAIGAVGAGDVKLFALCGSFISRKELLNLIVISFVIAAIFSVIKLVYTKTLIQKMKNIIFYVNEILSGNIQSYSRDMKDNRNLIHFSLPILIGAMITKICIWN